MSDINYGDVSRGAYAKVSSGWNMARKKIGGNNTIVIYVHLYSAEQAANFVCPRNRIRSRHSTSEKKKRRIKIYSLDSGGASMALWMLCACKLQVRIECGTKL